MMLLPTYYKKSENSNWEIWTHKKISHKLLKISSFNSISIYGFYNVNALCFGKSPVVFGHYPLWIADRGWVVSFLDAKINIAINEIKIEFYNNNKILQNNRTCCYLPGSDKRIN